MSVCANDMIKSVLAAIHITAFAIMLWSEVDVVAKTTFVLAWGFLNFFWLAVLIITKDNLSIDIAAVAYYHISDPEKAVIVIENVYNAINQISQTTVRNVVGRFSLDQLLSDTARINLQIKNVIDGHTEPWGTQVTAVQVNRGTTNPLHHTWV